MRTSKIILSSLAACALLGLTGCLTSPDSDAADSAATLAARKAGGESTVADSLRPARPPKPAPGDSLQVRPPRPAPDSDNALDSTLHAALPDSLRPLPPVKPIQDSLRPPKPPKPAPSDSVRPAPPVKPLGDSLPPVKPAHPPVPQKAPGA